MNLATYFLDHNLAARPQKVAVRSAARDATYAEIGVPDPHHPVSHHQNRPEMLEKLGKINQFHMKLFGYFMEKLAKTPDGDGTLLDHSILMHGAGMSNSDTHFHHDLPILLAGGGAGSIKTGRHLALPAETPLAWLASTSPAIPPQMTMLRRLM